MHKDTCFLLFWLLVALVPGTVLAAEYALVRDGKPQACLVIGSEPSWQDDFAARELRDYIQQMTDARLPIYRANVATLSSDQLLVLVGSPDSHEIIATLVEQGSLLISGDELTDV